jgi:hypothetical protein
MPLFLVLGDANVPTWTLTSTRGISIVGKGIRVLGGRVFYAYRLGKNSLIDSNPLVSTSIPQDPKKKFLVDFLLQGEGI